MEIDVMEWQTMETAPKDETWVLASNGGKIPFVTSWDDEEGWFTFNKCYENTVTPRTGRKWVPTHWMPLPTLKVQS